MDPVTALIILGIIAYAAASPDPVSLSASRGSVGAIRSGARSVGQSIGADWRSGGRERAKRRSERLDGWRKARTERDKKGRLVASPDERRRAAVGLSSAWAADRVKGAGRSAGRAVKAGVTSMPAGYRDGVEKARAKRDAKRTKPVEKVSVPSGGGEKGDDVGVGTVARGAVKGARKVGRNVAELKDTGQLAHECKDILQDIEQAKVITKGIKVYCDGLSERCVAANFSTKTIATGVLGVSEVDLQDVLKAFDNLREQFAVIQTGIKNADKIGEAAEAEKAEGKVEAFTPA